jgi:lysophospholipase L1-like esterase
MTEHMGPGQAARERIRAAGGATHAGTDAGQAQLPHVTVSGSSNAPTRFQDIYNAQTHKWAPAYVQPTGYRLSLSLTQSTATLAEPVKWHLESEDQRFGPLELTDNGVRTPGEALKGTIIARVPTAGPIKVTATWRGKDTSTKVDLRDFLIVSIGDSFSSGQGNPDQNGTESVGSRVLCESPTLIKVAEAIAGAKQQGLDWVDDEVPGLGEIVNLGDQIASLPSDLLSGLADSIADSLGFGGRPEQFVHFSSPAVWLEPLAWRSLKSSPSQAAQAAELPGWARLTTFVSLASSGATVDAGLLGPQYGFQKVGQVEEVRQMLSNPRDLTSLIRPVDVLIMSIGGNDCGFSGTLSDLTSEHFIIGMLGRGATQKDARARIDKALKALPAQYDKVNQHIRKSLDPKAVLIPEYPTSMFDGPDGQPQAGCGVFDLTEGVGEIAHYRMGVSKSDAAFIEEMGNKLNTVVSEAAQRNGWIVATGVAAAFKTHGYCAPHGYWVGATESCKQQDDLEGTCHPNAEGTKVVADLLAAQLHAILNDLTQTDPAAGVRPVIVPPVPRVEA